MLLSHSLAAHMKVLQESAYSLDEGDADDVNQTEYKMNWIERNLQLVFVCISTWEWMLMKVTLYHVLK